MRKSKFLARHRARYYTVADVFIVSINYARDYHGCAIKNTVERAEDSRRLMARNHFFHRSLPLSFHLSFSLSHFPLFLYLSFFLSFLSFSLSLSLPTLSNRPICERREYRCCYPFATERERKPDSGQVYRSAGRRRVRLDYCSSL